MNLPNKLTFMRILLVPIFVIFFYLGDSFSIYSCAIFCLASFTDFFGRIFGKEKQFGN